MKTLTSHAFQQAKSYILTQGRPLEQQLFHYHFGAGTREPVLAALAAYQNADGGFGRALEPDSRAPASSAVATQQAFAVLRAIEAPSTETMVRQAIAYLLQTYDPARKVWPIISPAIEEAPHAPWWVYADSEQNFGGFLANPRAALVGYVHDYADLVPADFLTQVTTAVVEQLAAEPNTVEMHSLLCYVALAETASLPDLLKNRIRQKLLDIIPYNVALEPANWSVYSLLPLNVVKSPDHFLAAVIPATALEANLDWLIDQQQSDGAWGPAWNWAFVDEAAWQAAERDWQSHITLSNLNILHAFGRIAEKNA